MPVPMGSFAAGAAGGAGVTLFLRAVDLASPVMKKTAVQSNILSASLAKQAAIYGKLSVEQAKLRTAYVLQYKTGVMGIGQMSERYVASQRLVRVGYRHLNSLRQLNNANMLLNETLAGTKKALIASAVAVGAMTAAVGVASKALVGFEKELINTMSILSGDRSMADSANDMRTLGSEAVALSFQYAKSQKEIAAGMYHLSSAGLNQKEVLEVLKPTLQLAVGTQADYAEASKYALQGLKAFNMEISEITDVVDTYAWTIQNSLVTWDKLSEGVKFAAPWFSLTGQSIQTLSAAIGVLTDRGLEAGIAGRNLRQTMAELVQHGEVGGIKLLDAAGNVRDFTDIVHDFAIKFAGQDYEIIKQSMEDLGIRGATSFANLVAGYEEYIEKIEGLKDRSGTAADLATKQMKSISAQWTILKSMLAAPFATPEEGYGEYLNAFAQGLHGIVQRLQELFVKDGGLTDFSKNIRDLVLNLLNQLIPVLETGVRVLDKFMKVGAESTGALGVFINVFHGFLKIIEKIPAPLMEMYITFKALSMILPIISIAQKSYVQWITISAMQEMAGVTATKQHTIALAEKSVWQKIVTLGNRALSNSYVALNIAMYGVMASFTIAFMLMQRIGKVAALLPPIISAIIVQILLLKAAIDLLQASMTMGLSLLTSLFILAMPSAIDETKEWRQEVEKLTEALGLLNDEISEISGEIELNNIRIRELESKGIENLTEAEKEELKVRKEKNEELGLEKQRMDYVLKPMREMDMLYHRSAETQEERDKIEEEYDKHKLEYYKRAKQMGVTAEVLPEDFFTKQHIEDKGGWYDTEGREGRLGYVSWSKDAKWYERAAAGGVGGLSLVPYGAAGIKRGIFGQHGYHGEVTEPTMFVAGEAGRERVDITPQGQSSGDIIIKQINIYETKNAQETARQLARQLKLLKATAGRG